jgi:hypothetical protein
LATKQNLLALQQTDCIDFNKPTKLIVTKPPNMSFYTDRT